MKKLLITQIRSVIGRPDKQRRIMRSLGLRKIGHQVLCPNRPEIRGQIAKVHHLVRFEEIDVEEAAPMSGE
ncbi:50S ribosomal protein L30 [bacterium]|nr:50S ribosomal protein L30 [candidate division CSSED10-310 bacterium]